MDKIIVGLLLIFVLAFNAVLEVAAMEPETVTFQGTVTRHPLSDKSVEVSGVIRFNYTDNDYIDEPFVILAGNRSAQYNKTLSWELTGKLEKDHLGDDRISHDYFTIDILCQINCEEAGLNRELAVYMENGTTGQSAIDFNSFFQERFGEDERDDAYIVNLNLIPRYFTLAVDVKLPNEVVASEDISLTLISQDYYLTGGSAYYDRFNVTVGDAVIKKGQTGGQLNLLFDLEEVDFRGDFVGEELYFGYQCMSSACERADLLQEAWLGDAQSELFSDALSAVAFEIISYVRNGDYVFKLPQALELLSRNNSVEITISRDKKSIDQAVEGNLIVEKLFYRDFCTVFSPSSPGSGMIDYSQNNVCDFPLLTSQRGLVSTTRFSLSEGELDTLIATNMETIKTTKTTRNFKPYVANGDYDDPYQTIRFECTSGCENTQNIKFGYLAENGKFSVRTEGAAKKFYQTEEYLQADLLLNLVRPPLLAPVFELLMDDEKEATD